MLCGMYNSIGSLAQDCVSPVKYPKDVMWKGYIQRLMMNGKIAYDSGGKLVGWYDQPLCDSGITFHCSELRGIPIPGWWLAKLRGSYHIEDTIGKAKNFNFLVG